MTIQRDFKVKAADNYTGYKAFRAGSFEFTPRRIFRAYQLAQGQARHGDRRVPARADARRRLGLLLRHVNFDGVFGTTNHYGEVDMFAGVYNDAYRKAGLDHQERFKSDELMASSRR